MKLLVKVLGSLIGLTLSGLACAVNMGDINVVNSLGAPMNVSIELGVVGKDDAAGLSAHLAPPEVFKSAGLDYPSTLPPLNFKIEADASGGHRIQITSVQPINEPFVNLLVELTWPSGKLLREYTFLLDSPGYIPARPLPGKLERVEQSVVDVSETELGDEETINEFPLPKIAATAEEKKLSGKVKNNNKVLDKNDRVPHDKIKVKDGDTLRRLAVQVMSSDVSLERALVALYRANTDAFYDQNMNRLKVGRILRIPEQSEIDALSQAKAMEEISTQVYNWQGYRQKLATASRILTRGESSSGVSGKIKATVAESDSVAKGSTKEVVRLSRGEASGDVTLADKNVKHMQGSVHVPEEDVISQREALKESNQRVAALEKNVQDLQRLINLKSLPPVDHGDTTRNSVNNQAAQGLDSAQSLPMLPPATPLTANGQAESERPATKSRWMDLQPMLNSQMFGIPLYIFGGAVLLSLFGLGYWLMRDEGKVAKNTQPSKRQIDHVIDHYNKIRTSSEPLRVTSDFYGVASKVAEAAKIQPNYFDPIGGADLFLSFGRDGQAESILQEALSKNPENHQIHLKLLSIYADRGDARSFARIAAQLKDSGDAYAWGQATIMGAKLEPENPMYSGDMGVISTAAAHLAAEVESTIDSHGVAKSDVDATQSLSNKITGLDFGDVNLNLNKEIASPPAPILGKMNTRWHDAATKLDLAKAYYEMGDIVGAREILEEVAQEGDPDHRADAETFLRKLPS